MMNSTDNSQGTLAKLLAKENIQIQHGNYSTAFFDVKNRILGLPKWKNRGKDVYDLLCGHEVGHALYTPADAFDKPNGCNKMLLNVVEDARIERMIQETYPGLISCFRRAYAQLHSEDFFGVKARASSTLNFPDRLNLKFKLGNLIDLPFSAEEQKFVDLLASTKSWDDVVAATLKLQEFLKEQADKEKEQPEQPKLDSQNGAPDQSDEEQVEQQDSSDETGDEESDEDNKTDGNGSDDSEDESEESNSDDSANSDEQAEESETAKDAESDSAKQPEKSEAKPEDETPATTDGVFDPTQNAIPSELPLPETVKNFESRNDDLLDFSNDALMTFEVAAPSAKEMDEVIVPYSEVNKLRRSTQHFMHFFNTPHYREEYQRFMTHTKKVVSNFIKEFELRKAAYQYSRATVSKTGSLNMNRLHAYKTSDDLFLSVTKLANAKNHAMVMFVDYSGSMSKTLPSVLNQVINLSLFCRNLGIPFKVYAFTSDNSFSTGNRTDYFMVPTETAYSRVLISNLSLLELVSSDLNRADFDDALYALFLRASYGTHGRGEGLGGTPLNETLIVAHKIVNDMKAKFSPDRMISIFLTDGNGHHLKTVESEQSLLRSHTKAKLAAKSMYSMPMTAFTLNGKKVKSDYYGMTTALIKNLRQTTNSEVIGFFVAAMNEAGVASHVAKAITTGTNVSSPVAYAKWTNGLAQEYKRSDVVAINEGFCYSKYFVVPNCGSMELDTDDEINIDSSTMTRGKMAREFMKYSSAKKTNRVFVSKFAEALA